VDAVNGATTPGKVETGDRIAYRFDKPIDPRSLFTGWNGAGTRTVDVMFDADLQSDPDDFDHVRILGVNGEALGVLDLRRSNYVGVTDVHFDTSELDLSADFRTVTITLGGATVGAEWTDGARMVWQPTTLIEDLAGNPLNTAAPVLEQDTPSGGTDRDF
jgi:hypothetical protein